MCPGSPHREPPFGSISMRASSLPEEPGATDLLPILRGHTCPYQEIAEHDASLCNPGDPAQQERECVAPENFVPRGTPPNRNYLVAGAGETPIDPALHSRRVRP